MVNRVALCALEALPTVIADLHPAASGPMTAEKQPAWTDDCRKAKRFSMSAGGCRSKEGPADGSRQKFKSLGTMGPFCAGESENSQLINLLGLEQLHY